MDNLSFPQLPDLKCAWAPRCDHLAEWRNEFIDHQMHAKAAHYCDCHKMAIEGSELNKGIWIPLG